VKYHILIVDDDRLLNTSLKNALDANYNVDICERGEEALMVVNDVQPDLILLDVKLGAVSGVDLLEKIKQETPQIPVLMITAFADVKTAVRAMKLGAEDFILKPLDLDHMEVSIQKALRNLNLQREVKQLKAQLEQTEYHYENIIGKSKALLDVLKLAEKLARSEDTTVLIEGESGTGKELIARFIHKRSSRAPNPFISVNCGAIPKELAESEFFGYEKGAFTGATEKMRQGKFELAHTGTILLDEVVELSLDMQVKLLRVLQDKKFYRLGGSKEISSDVRIIAATNQDTSKAVAEGKLREDLFYRLNVANIKIPPLRERREDILPLAQAFLQEFNIKFGKRFGGFSKEASDILERHQWKGNVRELRNVIERVALIESGDMITADHLHFLQGGKPQAAPGGKQFVLQIPEEGIEINQVMKALILETLEITKGNQVKAAKILGLTRSKLRYRIEQLGIQTLPKTYT